MATTNGAAANSKRNRDICKLLDTKKVSYGVIAKMMGTTRNAVAGIAFRRRHPYIKRGYRPKSYQPKTTIRVAL